MKTNATFILRQLLTERLQAAREHLAKTHDTSPVAHQRVPILEEVLALLNEAEKPNYNAGWRNYEGLRFLQAVMYALLPPMVGASNACNPQDNYFSSLRKWNRHGVERVRKALIATANSLGLNPHDLPPLPSFHQFDRDDS